MKTHKIRTLPLLSHWKTNHMYKNNQQHNQKYKIMNILNSQLPQRIGFLFYLFHCKVTKIIYLNFIIWEMTCQAWFVSLGQFYGVEY